MHLPELLSEEIEKISERIPLAEWVKLFQGLAEHYRTPRKKEALSRLASSKQHLAYLQVRMPATYAVVVKVFKEVARLLPAVQIDSLGDVGAGPGTGLWAAWSVFDSLSEVTCYERDKEFIALGKRLAEPLPQRLDWNLTDLAAQCVLKEADLFLASYALGEMREEERNAVIEKLWQATGKVLVIIEPGTPAGFETIRQIRSQCIGLGGHLIAPCPHSQACPMQGTDWCHFAARVERSRLHRQIKGGTLNFEDEKFSYLIFAKEKGETIQGRILARPQKHSGFVSLRACQQQGLQEITVTRKSKELYRTLRKAEWGDSF